MFPEIQDGFTESNWFQEHQAVCFRCRNVISLLICFQITKGDILSREADAKKSLEDYCCSPQFQRLIVLHCKLFRFSKTTAGKTDEGK